MSPIKKFTFTFIAVVCIPLLFFLALEGILRLFGVGTNYDYFHEININGELHYQDNKAFANQFYPASLGIAPLNNTISASRDKNEVRVLVLGGSAAQGFPHINHGLDRHLTAHLRMALPDKKIEVINTAMTSVNSHVVYEVARTIPANSADYAIILMGNNEVVGPYGPSTFSQNFLPNLSMIRALQALKRTHTWQAIAMLVQEAQPASGKTDIEWEGMEMFTEFSVPHNDERLEDVYSHYENNLREIIDILQDKNMHVILSSVPVNLRDSAPFGSIHSSDITEAELSSWNALNEQADKAFTQKNWAKAKDHYQALLKIDNEYAESHFRLATTLENMRDYALAETHFKAALHYDTKRFRSNHVINEIVAQVASDEDKESLSFVDSVAIFKRASQPYVPGWNLLHEHVHFDYEGNYYLANAFTQAILADLTPSKNYSSMPKEQAAELIGFPNHETNQVMDRLLKMVQKSPFTNQSNFAELKSHTESRREQISKEVGTPADMLKKRQKLIEQNSADWKIHYELAELNRFLRNKEAFYFHLTELIKLHPHNHESYIKLAEFLSANGKFKEAVTPLKQSLYYVRNDRSKSSQALGWIGLNHMRTNNYEEGKLYLEQIVDDYSEQIAATMRAYGTLVKYAKENKQNKDMYGYVNAVERYANMLIKQDRVQEFPLLYRRMAQIMTIAGDNSEAQRWQALATKDKS